MNERDGSIVSKPAKSELLIGLHSGKFQLSDQVFEKQEFQALRLGPGRLPDSIATIKNCVFRNCDVRYNFSIPQGAVLEDVVFDNVSFPGEFNVSSHSILNRVVMKSSRKVGKMLWVKPAKLTDPDQQARLDAWIAAESAAVEWMLDFSQLRVKEIEIIGLPVSKLRWNPELHMPFKLEWKKHEAWKYPVTSYWGSRMRRLDIFKVTEGMYSLPTKGDRHYDEVMAELPDFVKTFT